MKSRVFVLNHNFLAPGALGMDLCKPVNLNYPLTQIIGGWEGLRNEATLVQGLVPVEVLHHRRSRRDPIPLHGVPPICEALPRGGREPNAPGGGVHRRDRHGGGPGGGIQCPRGRVPVGLRVVPGVLQVPSREVSRAADRHLAYNSAKRGGVCEGRGEQSTTTPRNGARNEIYPFKHSNSLPNSIFCPRSTARRKPDGSCRWKPWKTRSDRYRSR